MADALHQWMQPQRQRIAGDSATAPIDYCLNRWLALTRFLDDGDLPIETRWIIASSRLRAGGGTGCSSVH